MDGTSIQENTEAVKTLDLKWARRQALAHLKPGAAFPTDEVLLASLHKTRYELLSIPQELRHESGRWLRERNFSRVGRLGPLLPEGQLPGIES